MATPEEIEVKLTDRLAKYDGLIRELRKNAELSNGTPAGRLLDKAADALIDLRGTLSFRTGYLIGLAVKHGEDLGVFA